MGPEKDKVFQQGCGTLSSSKHFLLLLHERKALSVTLGKNGDESPQILVATQILQVVT